uniref:Chromatin accessibility complex protein 1 n=1 Tax=Ditylenchus dipsaci TaxID=166011 RepID=A0A915ERC6_9BILA
MASAGSDSLKANDEGLFAMTKATEAFVMMLARGAYEHTQSDNQLTYNSLAEFVQSNEDLVHIHEMVPRKVKFSSIENQLDT